MVALGLAVSALACPAPSGAVTHPETTRMERPGTPAERVRLRVLDKVEARKLTMTVPVGIRVPLPDALHSVRVTGYTEDFRLDRMPPGSEPSAAATEGGKPAAEAAKPVPRSEGQTNAAVRLQVLREGEPIAESWVFARAPHLFQPSNMRYTFALLGAGAPPAEDAEESKKRP
jgi:hypothetical protein